MNINYEIIKKYFEENKTKVKIAAAILVVLIAFVYYKTDLSSNEIQVNSQTVESSAAQTDSEETNSETVGGEQHSSDNTAVSYHSTEAFVDISGEVMKPGVYKVTTSTRLFEVIEMAGGLTENANYNSLNQAEMVYDGEKVIVPHVDADKIYEVGQKSAPSSGNNLNHSMSPSEYSSEPGLININTADASLLQTLPGIGPVKSQSIVDYRNTNGKFSSIEDIKKVSGIGKKTYEAIKDLIVS